MTDLIIQELNIDKDIDYRNVIEKLLSHESVSHKQKVEYAVYCCKDLDKYYDTEKYKDVYKAKQKCLELLADWLLNPKSVSKKDLEAAANAAHAAVNAAYAAANAAHAAVNAAYAAAHAAAYAAHAAHAAAYAAHAAAYAAAYAAVYDTEMKKHLVYLLRMLKIDKPLVMLVLL